MGSLKLQDLASGSRLWPWWSTPRQRPHVTWDGCPIRSTEKLRFADAVPVGQVSNTVFAVSYRNARMGMLCDPQRVPIPDQARFVIARLELAIHREMYWPGTVEIGTRLDHVGRSSVSIAQGMLLKEQGVAATQSIVALIDTAMGGRPPETAAPCDDCRATIPRPRSPPPWHRCKGEEA